MDFEDIKNATSISSSENILYTMILVVSGIAEMIGKTVILVRSAKIEFKSLKIFRVHIIVKIKMIFVAMFFRYFHFALASIMLLLTIPLSISEKQYGYWNLSQSACKFHKGIAYFCYSMSLLFLFFKTVVLLIEQNYGKWKDHERFFSKQYLVLHKLCASTLPIALRTTYLSRLALKHKKSKRMFRSKLTTELKFRIPIVSTVLIYAISALCALPVFIYSGKHGYEFCSCNILFPGSEKRLRVCEEFAAKFSAFNFNCPTNTCISRKEVYDFRNTVEKFLRNTANKTKMLNVNIINSIMTTPQNAVAFQSTTTNRINSKEYENFSFSFSNENCLDNLKHASISLKIYYGLTSSFCLLLSCQFISL